MLRGSFAVTWMLLGVVVAQASTLESTSGLTVWLRANNVTTSGDTVTAWQDLTFTGSGIGDNTTQDATLSDGSPSFQNNSLNNRPTVNFGGGGGYTFSGALGLSGQQDFTVFIVAQLNAPPATNNARRALQFGAINTHNGGESVGIDIGTPGFRYNNGNRLFDNDDFSTSRYGLGAWVMQSPHTYGSPEFVLDGQVATQSSSGNPGATINLVDQGYTIGKGIAADGSNNDFIDARLAEVLLFDRVLTQREYEQAAFYLTHRYSLEAQYTRAPTVREHTLTNINLGPAPDSAEVDAHESNVDAFLFLENENMTLDSAVDVNLASSGSYTNGFENIDGQIAAGTEVDVYMLSYDTADNSGTPHVIDVSVEFSTEILGIITGNNQLISTHASLGSGLTAYDMTNLGLEDNNVDEVVWDADNQTLSVTMRVSSSNLDQLRILVASIPEPGSAALLGVAGLMLLRRRGR